MSGTGSEDGGRPATARLSRWKATARSIIAQSEALRELDDAELLKRGRELRWRAKTDLSLANLLPEAFALVREVARRELGFQHFLVQIVGGIALFEGHIAEMQTGEGKTLTATLPAFLRGLTGRGCHIVTVNDYLAARDARIMGPIYERLGLSVGCIQTPMQTAERGNAYSKDITYGTAKEIGFDFLRDRLRTGSQLARGLSAPERVRRRLDGRSSRAARALFRAGRRSRQHPHRRGPYAADHRSDAAQHGRHRQPVALEPTAPRSASSITPTSSSSPTDARLI